MAERRMFAKSIINSDIFVTMPISTQALYFHLAMRADDDGFVSNPRSIAKVIGVNDDDIKILAAKKYILLFDSGVVVIKHWNINNYIQKDRYKPTTYYEEKEMLIEDNKNAYKFKDSTQCIQDVYKMDTQVRLGKDSIDKDSIVKNNITVGAKAPFTPPTLEEVQNYIVEKGYKVDAEKWWNYYDAKDWYIGKNKMVKWKSAVATWNTRNYDEERKAKIEAQKAYAKDVEMRAKSTQQKNQENFDAFGDALGRIANKYEQDRNTKNIGENQTDIAYIPSTRD